MGNQSSSEQVVRTEQTNEESRSCSPLPRLSGAGPAVAKINAETNDTLFSPVTVTLPSTTLHGPSGPFARPPRLPIPIEQEFLSPGSPIISPTDVSGSIDQTDLDGGIPRKGSVLSSTTADDEDINDENFRSANVDSPLPTIPTLVEWKEGGDAVYVTGTFAANWDKKFRLYSNGPSKEQNVVSALIPLPVGTHHLAFIVDNQMRTASHMPTTVEWTNALVNYIEVTVDSLPKSQSREIHQNSQQKLGQAERRIPTGHHPPLVVPAQTTETRSGTASQAASASNHPASKRPTKSASSVVAASVTKRQNSETDYNVEIPQFLKDLDAIEESSKYNRASAIMATQPAPPSLPMFLNKSILNGATPMKDDSSVLIMPNHTVLNHLATSSIKNGVLATSATTRYKKKYVTTIMYKPTSEINS